MGNTTRKISMMGFFAIAVVMVMDVYEYPVFATSRLQLVFFLLMGGILWFVPVALCSAEMATVDGRREASLLGSKTLWAKGLALPRFSSSGFR